MPSVVRGRVACTLQNEAIMKTLNLYRILACATLVAALSWGAVGVSFADGPHDAWSHDKDGYWDNHGSHHAFVTRENHHGYWRQHDDGTRVFINID
jgi:hypothetical protein